MGLSDEIKSITNCVECPRDVRAEETVWHAAILEESSRNRHVQVERVFVASINEKCERKEGFGVCGEVSRRYKVELRVGSDRILNALESEFCGRAKVVKPATELVTEGYELDRI